MAQGFSLGMLQFQRDITKNATPQYKVDPYGFLASLYAAHSRGVILNATGNGHFKTVIVKRKKRLTQSSVRDTATCDNIVTVPYVEDILTLSGYKEIAIGVQDEVIAAFDEYASGKVTVPNNPGLPMLFEFWDSIGTAANALLQSVDDYLVTKAVAAIGVNNRTNNNTAATINIPLNTTNNQLNAGVTQIYSDWKQNSFNGQMIAVGAGLMYNFMAQQVAKSPDQSGVDTRILTRPIDFWYDQNVPDTLGAPDNVIFYEKDAVQILEYLHYTGFKAGYRGTSWFGTLKLPFIVGDQLIPIEFDYQLRYNDCSEVMTQDGYSDTTVQRGYQMILSKNFDLYTIPADAYLASDPLTGNRGSLLYNITNA